MRDRKDEIEAAGARMLLIGTGSPQQAGAFAEHWAQGLPVYSDQGGASFAAAGMKRGLLTSLNLRSIRNAFRALWKGFRQTGVQGDPWQQGGLLLVACGGHDLLHQQIDEAGGDLLDVDALLAALRGRAGSEDPGRSRSPRP